MTLDYTTAAPALRAAADRAARRYGSDRDDLYQEAYLVYRRSLRSYRPSRGDFLRHLKFRLLRRLADQAKREARRAKVLRRVVFDLRRVPAPATPEPVWDRLAGDAAHVARVALLFMDVGTARTVRATVRVHFRRRGWSVQRINQAFTELRKALS